VTGIGYHHAGLDANERHLIEQTFTHGDLAVLGKCGGGVVHGGLAVLSKCGGV